MNLREVEGKVIYIQDESMYYYFAWVGDEICFYGAWLDGELPEYPKEGNKTKVSSWDSFFKHSKSDILEHKITDHPLECQVIQINVIKKLFTGWLI